MIRAEKDLRQRNYIEPTFEANGSVHNLNEEPSDHRYGYRNSFNKFVGITIENYRKIKTMLKVTETIILILGFISLFSAIYSMFKEAITTDHESPWMFQSNINATVLLIITSIVIFVMWTLLAINLYKFCMAGEEQLDTTFSHTVGLLVAAIIYIALVATWIAIDKEKHMDLAKQLQTYILIYVSVQSTHIMLMAISSLSRHDAVGTHSVHKQHCYQAGNYNYSKNHGTLEDSVLYKHFIATPITRWLLVSFAVVYMVTYAIICGIYVSSRIHGRTWHFQYLFMSFVPVIGVMIILMSISYIVWNILARNFDGVYRLHYNSYYYSCAVPAMLLILCITSYRHLYRDVDEIRGISMAQFIAMKESLIDRIVIIMLISFPIMGSGAAKLGCLWTNLSSNKSSYISTIAGQVINIDNEDTTDDIHNDENIPFVAVAESEAVSTSLPPSRRGPILPPRHQPV